MPRSAMTTGAFLARLVVPHALATCMLLTLMRGTNQGIGNASVYLWSGAQTIAREHRLQTGIVYSDMLVRASDGEVPAGIREFPAAPEAEEPLRTAPAITRWPPGVPLALAALVAAGLTAQQAGLCLQVAALLFLVTMGALLGERLAGPSFGVAVAYLLAVHPVLLANARTLGADVLCAGLMMAGVLATADWLEAPRHREKSLLLAVLAAALAAHVHYAGTILYVFEASMVTADLAAHLVRRSPRKPWRSFLVGTALFPALLLPLALRNLSLTGHLGGAPRLPLGGGVLELARDAAQSGILLFPLLGSALPGKLDFAVSTSIVLLHAGAAVALARERRVEGPPPDRGAWRSPAGWALLAFSALYTVIMLVIRARVRVEEPGGRLLLPALVGFVILGAHELRRRLPANRAPLLAGSFGALLAMVALVEGAATFDRWQGFRSAASVARAASVRELLGADRHRAGEPPARLFSDRVVELHFGLDRPVSWLPPPASLPSLQRIAGGARLGFFIQHASPYFPCARYQEVYEALLSRHADGVVRGEHFDLYWLSSSPEEAFSPAEVEAAREVRAICGSAEPEG